MKKIKNFKYKETSSNSSDKKFDLTKNIIYLISTYYLLISAIYLFGYWSNFELNIFEYIAFSDIIKYALKPLAISMALLIFAFIYNKVLFSQIAFLLGLLAKSPSPAPAPAPAPAPLTLRSMIFTSIANFAKDMKLPSFLF